jgi:hypothetical protein
MIRMKKIRLAMAAALLLAAAAPAMAKSPDCWSNRDVCDPGEERERPSAQVGGGQSPTDGEGDGESEPDTGEQPID